MNALIEYFKKEVNYKLKLKDLEAINEQRNIIRKEYESYRKQRLEMFLTGFGSISLKLKEMYQMITLGGDAELELIDSLDPFSEGIAFSVRPPKKSWKQISNLSGGEKTLSSLALVFALHYYKPTPLYVMDEIDAALVRNLVWIVP
jgi:structural maintenance of chromosome 4